VIIYLLFKILLLYGINMRMNILGVNSLYKKTLKLRNKHLLMYVPMILLM